MNHITFFAILEVYPQNWEKNRIFHQQILKSSLFSARIEGNHLTLVEASSIDFSKPQNKSRLEISNVLKVLQGLDNIQENISKTTILSLHKKVMDKIDSRAGKFRKESSGIFDGYGNIIYLTPAPKDTLKMLDILIDKINSHSKQNKVQQLTTIAQCHYYFEKAHPFIDGNGRTGRIILQHQLRKTELFANYILPIDEYFEKNRSDYYFYLEKNTRNIDQFVIFFLKGIIFSLRDLNRKINQITNQSYSPIQSLLPRRQELINIVNDHPYISLDSLSRRFPTIATRTISYDINWLVKNNFIIKHGQTRGVRYSIVPN